MKTNLSLQLIKWRGINDVSEVPPCLRDIQFLARLSREGDRDAAVAALKILRLDWASYGISSERLCQLFDINPHLVGDVS